MKSTLIEDALKDFKNRLTQKYGDDLISLILFGSVAREEDDEGSDVDVLVVLRDYEDFWQEFHVVTDIAYQVSMDNDFQALISPVLFKESEYKNAGDILLLSIRGRGVVI